MLTDEKLILKLYVNGALFQRLTAHCSLSGSASLFVRPSDDPDGLKNTRHKRCNFVNDTTPGII